MPGLKQLKMEVLEMIIGEILLKTGTGEEVEGVVAELNTWMQIIAPHTLCFNHSWKKFLSGILFSWGRNFA